MADLPDGLDEWLPAGDGSALGHGRILRYQYVGQGKSRALDVTLEVDDDGNVVGAGPLRRRQRRALQDFADAVGSLGPYVAPRHEVRGGQYEIVTVMRGDEVHRVVFDNVDRSALEILREAAEDLR